MSFYILLFFTIVIACISGTFSTEVNVGFTGLEENLIATPTPSQSAAIQNLLKKEVRKRIVYKILHVQCFKVSRAMFTILKIQVHFDDPSGKVFMFKVPPQRSNYMQTFVGHRFLISTEDEELVEEVNGIHPLFFIFFPSYFRYLPFKISIFMLSSSLFQVVIRAGQTIYRIGADTSSSHKQKKITIDGNSVLTNSDGVKRTLNVEVRDRPHPLVKSMHGSHNSAVMMNAKFRSLSPRVLDLWCG
jgi:hypothetical protein